MNRIKLKEDYSCSRMAPIEGLKKILAILVQKNQQPKNCLDPPVSIKWPELNKLFAFL